MDITRNKLKTYWKKLDEETDMDTIVVWKHRVKKWWGLAVVPEVEKIHLLLFLK